MALNNYSTANVICVVNGRNITDFGETDPAITHAQIDPEAVLRRGQGGNALRLDRINPGRTFTINLQPGSPDSAFMQGLINSRANITISVTQLGTLETALGSEGIITGDGSVDRAGQSVSDDQYTIECNIFTQSKGGE